MDQAGDTPGAGTVPAASHPSSAPDGRPVGAVPGPVTTHVSGPRPATAPAPSPVSAPAPASAPREPRRAPRRHLRSAVFAAFFAPIALSILGLSVTDLQATAAVGQPLSSSEGIVGIMVSTLLLVLVGLNSEDSPSGMVVTSAAAVVVGLFQLVGVVPLPGRTVSGVSGADLVAALSWGLYPLSVLSICLGATVAVFLGRRRPADPDPEEHDRALAHGRERTAVASTSLALVGGAVAALLLAAPRDTTEVAARGLPGILVGHAPRPLFALLAAVLLGLVALGSRWSVLGTQVPAWLLMILPGLFAVPVWSTLTGVVITPGASHVTAVGLTAPVVTALGSLLVATSLGVHWMRRALPPHEGDPDAGATEN